MAADGTTVLLQIPRNQLPLRRSGLLHPFADGLGKLGDRPGHRGPSPTLLSIASLLLLEPPRDRLGPKRRLRPNLKCGISSRRQSLWSTRSLRDLGWFEAVTHETEKGEDLAGYRLTSAARTADGMQTLIEQAESSTN